MNNSSLNTANAYRLTYSNASTGANLSRDDSTKLPYAEKAESEGSRASMACAEMRMTEAQPTPLSQIDSLEAQIRHDGATAVFFQAAKEGHYETIRHMLPRWDVDPRAFDSACLQETTKSDEPSNTTTLRLLLEDGRANPLANNGRALWHAALGGNVEPLKLLLADPRVLGNPELIRKTFCGLYSGLYRTNPQRCDPVTLEPYMVARNAQQGLTRHAECLSLFIKTGHIQFNELREAIYVATSLHSIDLARALLNQPTLYQQGKIPDFSVGTDGFRNRDSHYLSIHKQSSYYSYDGSIINERNSAKSVIIKFLGQMLIEGSLKVDVEHVICKKDRQIPQLQRARERGLKNTHNRLRMIVTGLQSRGIDASIINKIIHGMREDVPAFPFALPAERRNLVTKMVEQLTS